MFNIASACTPQCLSIPSSQSVAICKNGIKDANQAKLFFLQGKECRILFGLHLLPAIICISHKESFSIEAEGTQKVSHEHYHVKVIT